VCYRSPVDLLTGLLQTGWLLLAIAALPLAAVCARTLGLPAWRGALVVVAPFALSLGLTIGRAPAPLHANGHAWREAREVMAPDGRCRECNRLLHGRGGFAAQRTIVAVQQWAGRPPDPLAGTTRVPVAAAAAGTALLVLVMTGRSGLALLAGALFALAPLSRSLAVSGSSLAVTAAALPWSLALALAARRSGRLPLVAAGGVAAALASTSHTAAVSWLPALVVAWPLAEPGERRPSFALGLPWFVLPAVAWTMHLVSQAPLLEERNAGGALLAQMSESWQRSVLLDPRWTARALPALAAGSALVAVLSRARSRRLATLAALVVASAPFLTPNACLSDVVRYETCLLPLVVALASDFVGTAGRWLGNVLHVRPLVPQALLASTCLVPFGPPPLADLATVEHEFVSSAVGQLPSPARIVLPPRRDRRVRHDFPDFLLPTGVSVVVAGEPAEPAGGPRLVYAGVACASWPRDPSWGAAARDPSGLRPECRSLIAGATPWRTFVLHPSDLPPRPYHEVATGVRLGFFRLPSGAASAAPE
jgi:hypothetical protein